MSQSENPSEASLWWLCINRSLNIDIGQTSIAQNESIWSCHNQTFSISVRHHVMPWAQENRYFGVLAVPNLSRLPSREVFQVVQLREQMKTFVQEMVGPMETGPLKICESAGKSVKKKIGEFPLISTNTWLMIDVGEMRWDETRWVNKMKCHNLWISDPPLKWTSRLVYNIRNATLILLKAVITIIAWSLWQTGHIDIWTDIFANNFHQGDWPRCVHHAGGLRGNAETAPKLLSRMLLILEPKHWPIVTCVHFRNWKEGSTWRYTYIGDYRGPYIQYIFEMIDYIWQCPQSLDFQIFGLKIWPQDNQKERGWSKAQRKPFVSVPCWFYRILVLW